MEWVKGKGRWKGGAGRKSATTLNTFSCKYNSQISLEEASKLFPPMAIISLLESAPCPHVSFSFLQTGERNVPFDAKRMKNVKYSHNFKQNPSNIERFL